FNRRSTSSVIFPYTTLFRSTLRSDRRRSALHHTTTGRRRRNVSGRRRRVGRGTRPRDHHRRRPRSLHQTPRGPLPLRLVKASRPDRKSTRLNSSHVSISYAV